MPTKTRRVKRFNSELIVYRPIVLSCSTFSNRAVRSVHSDW